MSSALLCPNSQTLGSFTDLGQDFQVARAVCCPVSGSCLHSGCNKKEGSERSVK